MWSQNASRTIAVDVAAAVIVVTRQQVAGTEKGGRGGDTFLCMCVCVCAGVCV